LPVERQFLAILFMRRVWTLTVSDSMSLLFSGLQTEKQKVPLPDHHLSLDYHISISSSAVTTSRHQPIHWSLARESCDTVKTQRTFRKADLHSCQHVMKMD
jgi:hypothetical protein